MFIFYVNRKNIHFLKMSRIQLPYGGIVNENEKTIKLTLPTNYKSEVLFSHLPYLANLRDPIFQSSNQNVINNREDLQKYFLAAGDLNNSIQENLDLIVTDGHLNDAAVRHTSGLNPQTDFFKNNLNPLDVLFKDIAVFDAQNPIIGSLLTQIQSFKIKPKGIKRALDKAAPDIKDILLKQKKLDKLK